MRSTSSVGPLNAREFLHKEVVEVNQAPGQRGAGVLKAPADHIESTHALAGEPSCQDASPEARALCDQRAEALHGDHGDVSQLDDLGPGPSCNSHGPLLNLRGQVEGWRNAQDLKAPPQASDAVKC